MDLHLLEPLHGLVELISRLRFLEVVLYKLFRSLDSLLSKIGVEFRLHSLKLSLERWNLVLLWVLIEIPRHARSHLRFDIVSNFLCYTCRSRVCKILSIDVWTSIDRFSYWPSQGWGPHGRAIRRLLINLWSLFLIILPFNLFVFKRFRQWIWKSHSLRNFYLAISIFWVPGWFFQKAFVSLHGEFSSVLRLQFDNFGIASLRSFPRLELMLWCPFIVIIPIQSESSQIFDRLSIWERLRRLSGVRMNLGWRLLSGLRG